MNFGDKLREMEIRDATMEDSVAACEVMRRSIAELCVADHRGDVDVLARWLSNKTPDTFRSWIAHQGNSVLVAAACTISRRQSSCTWRARKPGDETGQCALHSHQHRDGASLLPCQRLRRGWTAGGKIRHIGLSDVEGTNFGKFLTCMRVRCWLYPDGGDVLPSDMEAARSSIRLLTERENLAGDAKGKGTSGSNREADHRN